MRPLAQAAALLALGAGCGGSPGVAVHEVPLPTLRAAGVRAPDDPTVRPARLVPGSLARARPSGGQAGGGTRAIDAGPDGSDVAVRVVSWPDGSIVAAPDWLPGGPSAVVAVPERMGGGFLFAVGNHLWRSDTWLGRAHPLLTAAAAIGSVQVGLDRVYLRSTLGALGAIDPRTGAAVDLGPLPAGPAVSQVAALDAWRAVAVVDLRGPMFTVDAGSRWRPMGAPIDVTNVLARDGALVVGGLDAARQTEWWEVMADGAVGRLPASPLGDAGADAASTPSAVTARALGDRPLAAAITDGWPLVDGTVLVARDGSLVRVRLGDGGIAEVVPDAFSLKPSRCHPLSLATHDDPAAFGFVCGEPRGRTIVYRWRASESRLVELRRFGSPREVLASGNGALVVRGPCAPAPLVRAPGNESTWCVMAADETWRDLVLRGDDVDRARLVALADGHVAIVRPPREDDLSTARLTVTDGVHATHVPLDLPVVRADVARVLRSGLWMDGFEERRPGVLGGWIDAPGVGTEQKPVVLGVEIGLDGKVRVGEYVRNAGPPFVSGRWAFGWSPERKGFESTDGGMTWRKDIPLPAPIAQLPGTSERACGPVGCVTAGWLRVGWGASGEDRVEEEPPPRTRWAWRDMPSLDLVCEPTAGPPPEPKPPAPVVKRLRGIPTPVVLRRGWVAPSGPSASCSAEPTIFQGHAGPATSADDCLLQIGDASGRSMARLYAWGPRSTEWDALGKWKVAWSWPWGGWTDARASAVVGAPWSSRDVAARTLGIGAGMTSPWTLVPGDDPDHALLVDRRQAATRSVELTLLETDRAPVEVRGPGSDGFADFQGATRIAGRWYVATSQGAGELAATVVWALDGSTARQLARLPRAGGDSMGAVRLGRRTDGVALGVVVDGQATLDRGAGERWVAAVDLESGAVADPEPLAAIDGADPASALCTGDDAGWEVDLPYSGSVHVSLTPPWGGTLRAVMARLRLSHTRGCIERIGGSLEGDPHAPEQLSRPARARPEARSLDVGVFAGRTRYGLRCSPAR